MVDEFLKATMTNIFEGLCSSSPSRQYDAYLRLCEMRDDQEVDAAMDLFMEGREEARPYVIRYLVDVANKQALVRLMELVKHDTGQQRERTLDALDRIENSNEAKIDLLVDHLRVDLEDDILKFVIKGLGKARTMKATVKLAMLFPELKREHKLEAIETLENIRDARGLTVAREAMEIDDEGIICQALHLIRDMGTKKDHDLIIKKCKDDNPVIREYACWCLSKKRREKDRKVLWKAIKDKDEKVRLSAASSLLAYPSRRTARLLIEAVASDPSVQVRKTAGFTLSTSLTEVTTQELIKSLEDKEEDIRRCSMEQLGLRGEQKTYKTLVKSLREETSLSLKVSAASALGQLSNIKALPFLREALSKEIPLAYASALAICRLLSGTDISKLEPIVDPESEVSEDILQVFAQYLDKVAHISGLPDTLIELFRRWMKEVANTNCRYLATRIVGECGQFEDFWLLVPYMDRSENKKIREMAHLGGLKILKRFSTELQTKLSEGWKPVDNIFWSLLSQITTERRERKEWLRALMERLTRHGGKDSIEIIAVLNRWSRRYPDFLMDNLDELLEDSRYHHNILDSLKRCLTQRPLSDRETEFVIECIKSRDEILCGLALECVPHVDPTKVLTPLIELATRFKGGPEKETAQKLVAQLVEKGDNL